MQIPHFLLVSPLVEGAALLHAQVPGLPNNQGWVAAAGVNFNGTGRLNADACWRMKAGSFRWPALFFAFGLALMPPAGAAPTAGDSAVSDRAAVERVYHEHRTGTQQAFAQAMPQQMLEDLLRAETRKQAVLQRVYGVTVTPEMTAAEVRRIEATTRAPEVLAEIKAALGGDPARFAATVARPLVVERMLRARFENDDVLHAPQRRETEALRARLLEIAVPDARGTALLATKDGSPREVAWQLAPRPAADRPSAAALPKPPAVPLQSTGGVYAVEATAQVAQVLGGPGATPASEDDRKNYFEDLEPALQNVLFAQLRRPGDVSAVIEMPSAFLLFVAKIRSAEALAVVSFQLPKRSYDEWLSAQPE